MTTKSESSEILFRTKEERAWLIKEKLDSYKPSSIRESKKLMIKIKKFKSTTKKVTEMTNKLSFWEIKLINKEEKALLIKLPLKNCNTYSQKNLELFNKGNKEIPPFRVK